MLCNYDYKPNGMYQTPNGMYQSPNGMYQSPNDMYQGPSRMYQGSNDMYQSPNDMYQSPCMGYPMNSPYMGAGAHYMEVDPLRYPDIYYIVHPAVKKKCDKLKMYYNIDMGVYPPSEIIDKTIEEVVEYCHTNHADVMKKYCIVHEEKMKIKDDENTSADFEVDNIRPHGLFGALVGTVLLGELLSGGHNRHNKHMYYPHHWGYPHYGYYR